VGSTNDWVKAAASEGAVEGLAVFAEEQTAGRGQIGRIWTAPPGGSILLSVLLRPRLRPDQLAYLTMLGACAAAGAVVEVSGRPVSLKWPNDVITDRGKLGGALIETSIVDNDVEYAVLGIGINANVSRRALASIPGATSLQAELGHEINRNALARALLNGLDERYRILQVGNVDSILTEWRERLSTVGSSVSLQVGGALDGPYVAAGVTDRGALVLRRPDGSQFEAVAGEVSVRPTKEGT
jgi:BirA family biotin operon repressor/biotin-[acetyl-CoA-carboxylase] ligase